MSNSLVLENEIVEIFHNFLNGQKVTESFIELLLDWNGKNNSFYKNIVFHAKQMVDLCNKEPSGIFTEFAKKLQLKTDEVEKIKWNKKAVNPILNEMINIMQRMYAKARETHFIEEVQKTIHKGEV